MDRLKLFIPLLVFLVLSGLLYQALSKDPGKLPSALIDKPMPEFALPSLIDEGRVITAESLIGKPYLLNIWATWCPTCKVEHPFLYKLHEMGITIVGLNYKDDSVAARKFLQTLKDPYVEVIEDIDGTLGLDLGVYGAPETFVVDAKGIIRFKVVGEITDKIWTRDVAPLYFGG
jgi:cytochrome c biogenesis protein CcmG/thiol:disulfide interchange protein DsbE